MFNLRDNVAQLTVLEVDIYYHLAIWLSVCHEILLIKENLILMVYLDSILKPIGKERVAYVYFKVCEVLPSFQCGIRIPVFL